MQTDLVYSPTGYEVTYDKHTSIIVKIMPLMYKRCRSQMAKFLNLRLESFYAKRNSNGRVGVGRILRPQFAGDKRNAAPLSVEIAEGVFHKIHVAISLTILSTALCLWFEVVQWQLRLQMSHIFFKLSDTALCVAPPLVSFLLCEAPLGVPLPLR